MDLDRTIMRLLIPVISLAVYIWLHDRTEPMLMWLGYAALSLTMVTGGTFMMDLAMRPWQRRRNRKLKL